MSQKPKGIAARAGRWSAQHRKTAILRGWPSSSAPSTSVARSAPARRPPSSRSPATPAAPRRSQDDAFPDSTTGAGEIVLIQSKTLKADAS